MFGWCLTYVWLYILKLKRCDETTYDSVKKSLTLSDGGPSQRQAPGINKGRKLYMRVVIVSEAWPTVVQLKRKP